jgi:hypothetical protein
MTRRILQLIAIMALLSAASACRRAPDTGTTRTAKPLTETMSWGPIELTLQAEPATVDLTRDIRLSLKLTAPSEFDISFPAIEDRLQGFTLAGTLRKPDITRDGKTIREVQHLLTPLVADRYRIAPMALEYLDHGRQPPQPGWFPTRPVVFTMPAITNAAGRVNVKFEPVRLGPSPRTVIGWTLAAILAAGAAWAIWHWGRRLRRAIALRLLSPKERALRELEELLAQHLPEKNLIKDFYVELTMVVRRFIERRHRVRAPEQTTEEFLKMIAGDPRFSDEVTRKLRTFLQSADLVKFAAYTPESEHIARATTTAREYIESDADPAEPSGARKGGKA